MKKIIEYIKDPSIILTALGRRGYLKFISDRNYIAIRYFLKNKRFINLENPKTLNEKLQWLMLHQRDSILTKLVDKYEVKEYISKIIGKEYIIPTYGVWTSYDDIEWDKLPNEFILKTTHDSHCIAICRNKNKFNKEAYRDKFEKALLSNGYWHAREWPYLNVKPRIIAEKLLKNKLDSEIVDYKFYCYGGKTRYFMYSIGESSYNVRNHKFDINLQSIDSKFKKKPALEIKDITLPSNINKMIEISDILCKNFKHVRVDLYNIEGSIFFGEMTFYSSGGYMSIESKEYSNYLASLIKID